MRQRRRPGRTALVPNPSETAKTMVTSSFFMYLSASFDVMWGLQRRGDRLSVTGRR